MKKALIVGVLTIALAGCKQTVTPSAQIETQTEAQMAGEFESVAGAIQAGRPVSCTMTKKGDNTVMTYFLKGQKMKMSGFGSTGASTTGMMISDGRTIHTWDETTKKGFTMTLPEDQNIEDYAEQNGQNVPSIQSEEDKKALEDQGYIVDCKEQSIADSEFVPPSDVTFSDMSGLMESANTMMKENQSGSAPSEADQEAMRKKAEELMKQYQEQ